MLGPLICLFIIIILLLIASLLLDKKDRHIPIIWLCIFLAALFTASIVMHLEGTYRKGQIDALNGTFKYERQFAIPEGDSIVVDTLYKKLN